MAVCRFDGSPALRITGKSARDRLDRRGLASAAASTRCICGAAVSVTYAAAYARSGVGPMPCGLVRLQPMLRAWRGRLQPGTSNWWARWTGIRTALASASSTAWRPARMRHGRDRSCLAGLGGFQRTRLARLHRRGRNAGRLPRADLPIIIVHGKADGLVPMAFSSEPYVRWLEANGRKPVFWKVGHGQHFDAFLAFPGFGDAHVPVMPYAYAALDKLWAHVVAGEALPSSRDIATTPRGNGPLGASQLGEY